MMEILTVVFFLFFCTPSDGKGSVELGPCAKKVMKHNNNPNAVIPSCKEDGSYKQTQCTSISVYTTNYDRECWCVTVDGNEIPGTRKKLLKGNLDCEDNLDGRMVEPLSSDGCAVKDRPRCKLYVNHEGFYCEQFWTRKFCKHLCGLCGTSNMNQDGSSSNQLGSTGGQGGRPVMNQGESVGPQSRLNMIQGGSTVTKSKPKIKRSGCPASHRRPSATQGGSTGNQGIPVTNQGGSLVTHGKPNANRGETSSTQVFKCKNDHKICQDLKKETEHFCKQEWVKKNCENMCGLGCGSGDLSEPEQVFKCKKDHEVCPDYKKEAAHFCKQDWVKKNCENMCGLGCGDGDQ